MNSLKPVEFKKGQEENTLTDNGEGWLSKSRLNIIVAYTDKNKFIGFDNDIPWKRSLRGDARFVNTLIRLERNAALVMGRRTYDSMPKKKNIHQIVLTSNASFQPENAVVLGDFEKAVKYCRENDFYCIVFGGSSVYEAALEHKCRIFYTLVEEEELEGDVRYPGHDNIIGKTSNITNKVERILLSKGVDKTWEFDGQSFKENGISYSFYFAEN